MEVVLLLQRQQLGLVDFLKAGRDVVINVGGLFPALLFAHPAEHLDKLKRQSPPKILISQKRPSTRILMSLGGAAPRFSNTRVPWLGNSQV